MLLALGANLRLQEKLVLCSEKLLISCTDFTAGPHNNSSDSGHQLEVSRSAQGYHVRGLDQQSALVRHGTLWALRPGDCSTRLEAGDVMLLNRNCLLGRSGSESGTGQVIPTHHCL